MGILDDAIREHLELKRRHGAESDDLERLENEAFGPASRPGDPEFDTGAQAAAPAAPAEAGEAPAPEAAAPAVEEEGGGGFSDWFAGEEETTVAPTAAAPEAPAEEAPPISEEGPVPEPPPEPEPIGEAPATPAEQARVEHAELGDTADHPAPEQLGPADEAEPAADEPSPSAEEPAPEAAASGPDAEPPEPPESGIFDAGEFDEPDSEEQPAAPASGVVSPTTDHDLPPAPVEPPAAADESSSEDEDLLEETPDFLQETEGEDLWFEQGPPKDFDFDDD
jgi:hypothetical protein